jgi:hypothetical protein
MHGSAVLRIIFNNELAAIIGDKSGAVTSVTGEGSIEVAPTVGACSMAVNSVGHLLLLCRGVLVVVVVVL